jgi:hypothetical protein
MMDDVIEPSRAASPRRQEIAVKSLGEDPTSAKHGIAVKSARRDQQPNRAPGDRQIGYTPMILAMNAS